MLNKKKLFRIILLFIFFIVMLQIRVKAVTVLKGEAYEGGYKMSCQAVNTTTNKNIEFSSKVTSDTTFSYQGQTTGARHITITINATGNGVFYERNGVESDIYNNQDKKIDVSKGYILLNFYYIGSFNDNIKVKYDKEDNDNTIAVEGIYKNGEIYKINTDGVNHVGVGMKIKQFHKVGTNKFNIQISGNCRD